MELLQQVSNTQFLFPAAAVAVVLVCAALVFIFGFHTAEQPQFDKLALVVDDRKSSNKKRKTKEKKSSPNRTSNEDAKPKSESTKKSPAKEKKEEKVKEVEKPKPKERVENKVVKKEVVSETKKSKKGKGTTEIEKPADFDEGVWEEVPKKSDKKKVKPEEKEKKESPVKKNKKKLKEADVEAAQPVEEVEQVESFKILSAEGPGVDDDVAKALQAQVEEVERVLREAERRNQVQNGAAEDDDDDDVLPENELTEVKDLRSNKKKENKEKQNKKKANEAAVAKNNKQEENDNLESSEKPEDRPSGPVFDELGDTWTDAKVSKKSKKKPRKDQ